MAQATSATRLKLEPQERIINLSIQSKLKLECCQA